MPASLVNSSITWLAKCGPLSDLRNLGDPYLPTCSTNAVHAALAVASFVAYSSTNRVNVSIMTRMYPLSGKGPMKSMLRHYISLYVEVV